MKKTFAFVIVIAAILFIAFVIIRKTSNTTYGTGAPAGAKVSAPFRYAGYTAPEYRGWTKSSFFVPMSDGVKLAVDLIVPADGPVRKSFPVIFIYNPYDRSYIDPDMRWWEKAYLWVRWGLSGPVLDQMIYDENRYLVSHGYAIVVADMRGTGASFGSQIPLHAQGWPGREGAGGLDRPAAVVRRQRGHAGPLVPRLGPARDGEVPSQGPEVHHARGHRHQRLFRGLPSRGHRRPPMDRRLLGLPQRLQHEHLQQEDGLPPPESHGAPDSHGTRGGRGRRRRPGRRGAADGPRATRPPSSTTGRRATATASRERTTSIITRPWSTGKTCLQGRGG